MKMNNVKETKGNLLIIGGSYEQEPLVRKAKEMGYTSVVIDLDENAPGYNIADIRRKISTTDIPSTIALAKEFSVKGVLTNSSESAIPTVAETAKALGLPGNSPNVAEATTDKEVMKLAFLKKNLPVADFVVVRDEKEAVLAADKLKFPCIIKPVDSAGSRGVLKIDNPDEVRKSFRYSIAFSKKKKCLVEEFIEGIEMSADALSYQGKTEVLAISDKKKESGKNNVAMNIVYPPRFSPEEVKKAKNLIKKVVDAVGIINGPSHTEIIRRKKNDFVVLEIGSRGGGFYTFSKVVPAISGIDTMKSIIDLAVGNPIKIKPKRNNAAVLRFIGGKPGKIVELGNIDEARKVQGVLDAGYFLKKGDLVKKIEKDGDRVGYMIIIGKTQEAVIKAADRVESLMRVKTTPEKTMVGEKNGSR